MTKVTVENKRHPDPSIAEAEKAQQLWERHFKKSFGLFNLMFSRSKVIAMLAYGAEIKVQYRILAGLKRSALYRTNEAITLERMPIFNGYTVKMIVDILEFQGPAAKAWVELNYPPRQCSGAGKSGGQ